jgi:hypothetical protein
MTTVTINDKSAVGSVDKSADYFPIWKSGAQGKATAAQIVASVPMVGDSGGGGSAGIVPAPGAGDAVVGKFLKADGTWTPASGYKSASNTVHVAAAGADFTTIQAALSALSGYVLDPQLPQYITVNDGHYAVGAAILKEGPFGQATYIQGQNVYTRAVTSIASSSGSTGAWSIVLNMADVTNISVNDYVACFAPTGGTLPTYLAGCHQVTNVGASTITIASKHKATTAPSGAVSGNLTVFKTVLSFAGTDGIDIWSGSSCIILRNICFVGDGTHNGISLQDGGGRCYIDGVVGVANFDVGVYANYNTEMNGDGAIAVSGCTSNGFYADAAAFVESTSMVASGCSYGFFADSGGVIRPRGGYATGNTNSGCSANRSSFIIPTSLGSTGNGTWGFEADGSSVIALNTVTATTNVRGSYAPKYINSNDGYALVSNFSYGYNGTATPTGHNLFLGYGSGNTTTGATATTATHSSYNLGMGTYCLNAVTTGNQNVAMGDSAVANLTSGVGNVGVGRNSLNAMLTGNYNAAIGLEALGLLTSSSNCVGIGLAAGEYITGGAVANTTGSNSVYIGANAFPKADGEANQTVIGYATVGNGANTVTIGNGSVTGNYLHGDINNTINTNGQVFSVKALTELTTIAASATTDTAIQIPAGAIVLAVSVRVTATITCTANFTVGDSGSAARYNTGSNVAKTAGTTDVGTKAGAYYCASATSIRITPDTTPSDNTGRVRVTIHYILVTPPTA